VNAKTFPMFYDTEKNPINPLKNLIFLPKISAHTDKKTVIAWL